MKTTYQRKKAQAREIAIEWQLNDGCNVQYSFKGWAMLGDYFNKLGKRFGLLREFRENGIPC